MSVPARKKSRSSVRRRRSHDSLKAVNVNECENCKTPVKPHHACTSCGQYKGRQVVDRSRDAKREIKKIQARSAAKQTQESGE